MKSAVKSKKYAYDPLYPFAANLLGLTPSYMKDGEKFTVKYYRNSYCRPADTVESAINKITVEMEFQEHGKVLFKPYPMFNGTVYGYKVYVNSAQRAEIGPYEWEVIRPKIYGDFTEYFTEMKSAIDAFSYISKYKAADKFILNHYAEFISSFRTVLYNRVGTYNGEGLPEPVSITFNDPKIYGGKTVCEEAFIIRDINKYMTVYVAQLN